MKRTTIAVTSVFLFGLLAGACSPHREPASRTRASTKPAANDVAKHYGDAVDQGSAATFIMEFTGDEAVLHRAVAPSTARLDARAPRLVPGAPARGVLGHGEIVASVHGVRGEFLEAVAFQGRPVDFLEAPTPQRANPNLGGRQIRRSPDLRRIVVPTSAAAASIVFYRVDVIPAGGRLPELARGADVTGTLSLRDAIVGGDVTVAASDGAGSYRLRPLGGWALGTDVSSTRIEIPAVRGAWSFNVPIILPLFPGLSIMDLLYFPKEYLLVNPDLLRSLSLGKVDTLHAATPGPAGILGTYDIVILGEGFQALEESNFATRAQEFVDEIFGTPGWEPFKSRESVINVYSVWLGSVDSGVEFCPSSAGCDDVATCATEEIYCPRTDASWNDCKDCWAACAGTGAACEDCFECSGSGCVDWSCGWQPEYCRECGECGAGCGSTCDDECDDCHECFASCDDECDAYMDCSGWTVDSLDTWLEVEANSDDRGGIVNFRAVDEAQVWDAASRAVAIDEIDLIIVMVNCVFYGGRANSTDPIAYVSYMHPDEATNANQLSTSGRTMAEYFTGLAVHESTHAMASLGEEYASCALRVPGVEHLNHATEDQRAGDHVETVSWGVLAEASELDGTEFKAVTDCEEGDTSDSGFGLHWGAQYYDVTDVAGDGWYYGPCAGQDARAGCGSYRPTQSCTMNVWTEKLCRVCVDVLDDAIAAAVAPSLVVPSTPPDIPAGLERTDTRP